MRSGCHPQYFLAPDDGEGQRLPRHQLMEPLVISESNANAGARLGTGNIGGLSA